MPFSSYIISFKTILFETMIRFIKVVKQNKIMEKTIKFDFYGCLDTITNEINSQKLKSKIAKIQTQNN